MTDAERIAALQAELAAQRAEMQTLMATVSHDLRAPLRHIVSYAQLVQEDAGPLLNAEVQGFLATMTESARHMGRLLDGLGALAQLGTAPINLAPVALQALVDELVTQLTAQHPTRTLAWHIAPDLPTVQADAALLRQALRHVLDNAIKFTAPRDTAVITIRTLANDAADAADGADAASPGTTALQVCDNGVGYNPAQQGALFQVFGRLHTARQFEGTGMGLALTAKALQRMGGTVTSEGVLDGGCCVTLRLPSP